MPKTLWYCVTASDAVNLLKDGMSVKLEVETEDRPSYGYIYHPYLHGSFLKLLHETEEGAGTQIKIHLVDVIFSTNEEQLQIIEPGKLTYTVSLK